MTSILEELRALIGLKMCDGIGNIIARKLVASCGSAAAVFTEKKRVLLKIPGIHEKTISMLQNFERWENVDRELNFMKKYAVSSVSVLDPAYPAPLFQAEDSPVLLFYTGDIQAMENRVNISIVGTRHATPQGLAITEKLVEELSAYPVNIISGLAKGIDIMAHKSALTYSLPTFGIVGHGLQTIYPSVHKHTAVDMSRNQGGIITEFFSDELPNRENFPKRNRIIAGLSSCTIIVEAAEKGGALITASFAQMYKRGVLAFPGRISDEFSAGCNYLIKNKKAICITSVEEVPALLGLEEKKVKKKTKHAAVEGDEKIIYDLLSAGKKFSVDELGHTTQMGPGTCAEILFSLEIKGLIRALPGKIYELS